MNKILVIVEKDYLSFSKYNRQISEDNLNNTNVINVKNLKFTEDYIKSNIELISTFFNLIIIKFNINKVVIKNLEIAETVLILIKALNNIKYVNFTDDKELSYSISSLLIENKNLELIECYNLPDIMFYRFDKNQIKTRCEILSSSDFFKYNNIKTYSELFNKEKIVVEEYLSDSDIDDIIYFFSVNKNLKKIELKRYIRQNLITILKFLKRNNLKKITIIICERYDTTNNILDDMKLFDKLNKQYDVNIKIKYSKRYKDKNKIKILNMKMVKIIVLTCLIISLIFVLCAKFTERNENKNLEKNINNINKVVNDNIKEDNNITSNVDNKDYDNPYYTNYSQIYEDLLEINNDTVGWLKVNGTNINYPVVQSEDNDFYLNHSYDKSSNKAGWIFMDYRNDLDIIGKNTIIYGHSMLADDLMFSSLENILNSNWYNNENNLNISFSIKNKNITWKIFSIYVIEETNDYLYTKFSTDYEFIEFVNKIKNRSINNFNVDIDSNDKILTLSTCYRNNKNRIVVHAKML